MKAFKMIQAVRDLLEERRWIYSDNYYPDDNSHFKKAIDNSYDCIMSILYTDAGLYTVHEHYEELTEVLWIDQPESEAHLAWRNKYIDALYAALAELQRFV